MGDWPARLGSVDRSQSGDEITLQGLALSISFHATNLDQSHRQRKTNQSDIILIHSRNELFRLGWVAEKEARVNERCSR
jgi:hypothetical protein